MTEGGESIQNLTYPVTGAHPYGTLISYKKKVGIFTAKQKKLILRNPREKKAILNVFSTYLG